MRVWHRNVEMRDRAMKPNWLHLRKCEDNGLHPPKKTYLIISKCGTILSLSYNIPNPNIWTFLTLIQIYWPLVIKNEQFYENLLAVFRSGFNKYSLKRNRYLLQRDRIISDTQEHTACATRSDARFFSISFYASSTGRLALLQSAVQPGSEENG